MTLKIAIYLVVAIVFVVSTSANANFCQDSKPCGNNPCYWLYEWSSYLCVCPNSQFFLNTSCSANASNACTSNVCLNDGTCAVYGNTYKCLCPSGFLGANCEIRTITPDPCSTINPCLNGGTCGTTADNFYCNCTSGFMGYRCETPIPTPLCKANANLCQNGGTCVDVYNGIVPVNYTCQCAAGSKGANCEITINGCDTANCNNGLCFNQTGGLYICKCFSGWTGTYCDVRQICDPATMPCMHQGTCINNGTQCQCQPYFSGSRCEIINGPPCALQICSNGGTCYQLNATLYCDCLGNYHGQYCELI